MSLFLLVVPVNSAAQAAGHALTDAETLLQPVIHLNCLAQNQNTAPAAQQNASPPQTGCHPPGQNQNSSQPQSANPAAPEKQKDDRIFGVMPNYLTVNGVEVERLTWKGKYKMTAEGAFDPYEFVLVGVVSGIHQAENTDAPFGQGASGYAKRYGSGFADQSIGNMMTGAVYPSLFRTDPRYYRQGSGSIGRRLWYAASRIFVTRTDAGRSVFNASEFLGNATSAGISNVYYPKEDHTWSNNLNTFATQISIDAFGNALKEFWPDIHKLLKRGK
jgi:hypothetical protein